MRVQFKPRDPAAAGDPGEWIFDADDVLGAHAEMIERRFGGTWEQFGVAVQRGSAKARRILLWYFRMLAHPGYRIEDMPDFRMGELTVSYSVAELRKLREQVVKAPVDDKNEREGMLLVLDVQISETMAEDEARHEAAVAAGEVDRESDDAEGKAPSPMPGNGTG